MIFKFLPAVVLEWTLRTVILDWVLRVGTDELARRVSDSYVPSRSRLSCLWPTVKLTVVFLHHPAGRDLDRDNSGRLHDFVAAEIIATYGVLTMLVTASVFLLTFNMSGSCLP